MRAAKGAKAKRVSKIARGRLAKSAVFRGTKEKTVGGLRKDGIVRNSLGRLVSKRQSANARRRYFEDGKFKAWIDACKAARKALGLSGFVAVGGKSAGGRALYA